MDMELGGEAAGGSGVSPGDAGPEQGSRVDLHPPEDVLRIARRLQGAGYETWAVGGAVRDALRGEVPGDWDLTTAAPPREVQRLFRRTVPIGVEHGTVGVLGKDGHLYEVTTFRRDVETFGRRARVAFAETLEEDLERRDFTINAVAWHPLRRELRDPHGGVDDLERRILRTVGDAAERFAEDRLRVLRALRFAGRFGLEVEEETWRDLVASSGELDELSPERVREELYKVLGGQAEPSVSLRLYEQSGVLAALYPELYACVGVPDGPDRDVWSHQLATVDALPRSRPLLRLAALLHHVGKPAVPQSGGAVDGERDLESGGASPGGAAHAGAGAAVVWSLMRRLRASNVDANRVAHIVAQHAPLPRADAPPAELRRWLRRVGVDFYRDVLRLRRAISTARGDRHASDLLRLIRRLRALVREGPALEIRDLAIGGADLRRIGIPSGPLYGEILRDLLDRVTDDPTLNTSERLVEIVKSELSRDA